MQLTEEEAKQKWCPFSNVSASPMPEPGNHASNRMDNEPAYGSNCYAGEFMAWRWGKSEYEHPGHYEKVATNGDTSFIVPISYPEDYIEHKRGYCRLAGKPEGVGNGMD